MTVEDQDSSGAVSTSGTITVVNSIFDKINILRTAYGDITLKGGFQNELHLEDNDIIEGNNLRIKAESDDGKLSGQSHVGVYLDISWTPNHDHKDVLHYAFFKQKAVIQNVRGKIWFYNCQKTEGSHKRECKQYASYPGTVSEPIRDVIHFSGLTFAWTCTSDDCMGIFATDEGDISVVSLGKGITGMFVSEDDIVPNYIRLVATHDDKVEIFRGPKHEPDGMVLWYTMTQENANESWFCPRKVYHCPLNEDVLLVLNDCDGYNQKILKYKIGDITLQYINSTNFDSLNQSPFFCPMGNEFIVGSTKSKNANPLYSFSTSDDLNYWTVPKDLLGNSHWSYTCLTHMKKFVSYGYNKDGQVTATTIIGNRGSEQLRRYPNMIQVMNVNAAHSYEGFEGNIIHWLSTDDGPVFFEVFDKPILEIRAPKVDKETEYNVKFSFTNSGSGSKSFTKKVTVVP